MDTTQRYAQLEQELKAAGVAPARERMLVVVGLLFSCFCLAAVQFLFPRSYLLAFALPLALAPAWYYSVKSARLRARIFEKHGFRCQNCNKTPQSLHLFKATSRKFCPHCQLKYFP